MQAAQSGPAIIVFDGHCVLCSHWVGFLLKRDARGRFQFAAMQSQTGRNILSGAGLDPDDPSSFVLVENGTVLRETTAIIAVLKSLNAPWPTIAAMMRILPRGIRDWFYFRIARNRYRLFGQRQQCYAPLGHDAHRFLK